MAYSNTYPSVPPHRLGYNLSGRVEAVERTCRGSWENCSGVSVSNPNGSTEEILLETSEARRESILELSLGQPTWLLHTTGYSHGPWVAALAV